MSETRTRSTLRDISSRQVVLALLAAIIVTACGSTLVRQNGEQPSEPLALLEVELDQPATKALADGFGGEASGFRARNEPGVVGGLDDRVAQVAEAEAPSRPDDALIVRTASLELEVEDVAAILLDARAGIAALGGYVSGSDEFDQGERRWASVTYRVPVDRFEQALDGLRGLSDRVVRESTQSQEVTASVVDLEARIANLRASEAALVEIMERAGRIDDVLAVQMRLEDVRGQIERLDAQRKNLADQAALSTISVTWFTPVAAVVAAGEGWSLASEVDAALAQTVEALQAVASFGVWLAVVVLPMVGIPLLLVAVVLMLVRRRIGRQGGSGGDGSAAMGTSGAE